MANANPINMKPASTAKAQAKLDVATIKAHEGKPQFDASAAEDGDTFEPENGKKGWFRRLPSETGRGPLIAIVQH